MTDGASARRAKRCDTLIASAVLILLIAGWIGSLGTANLDLIWALIGYLLPERHAQV